MTLEVQWATRSEIQSALGCVPKTMRAMVAKLDGDIIGMCGIAQMQGAYELFSYVTDELLPYKKTILKAAKDVMKTAPPTVVAKSDPMFEGKMLRHLGFKKIEHKDADPKEEWFIWHSSQP